MNNRIVHRFFWAVVVCAVFASVPGALFAQAKPAAGAVNLYKEINDKKAAIAWQNAPATAIPMDVCTILGACVGQNKWITLPPATEGGQKVARALYLSQDSKKNDLFIMQRQTYSDSYYFLLGPDGNLQKAAFVQLGAKQWQPIAVSLVSTQFEGEKKVWHDRVLKLGAPAAPAAPTAQ
jgi:hypothetical protein